MTARLCPQEKPSSVQGRTTWAGFRSGEDCGHCTVLLQGHLSARGRVVLSVGLANAGIYYGPGSALLAQQYSLI